MSRASAWLPAGWALSRLRRTAIARRADWVALGVALVVLACLPAFALNPTTVRLLFVTLTWVATSVGWNLLGGFAGQVSFGFAVFYGLGAYASALLINAGVHPYAAFVAAAAVGAVASVIVGLPTFRMRGPYFAIATIGVTEAVRVVMSNLEFTGGASGLRIVEKAAFEQTEHYYTAVVVALVSVAASMLISKSKFGLALRAIRQDEDAAGDVGVNAFVCKLWVHAAAAALTALAGAAFARYAAFIHPQGVFSFNTSISILLMPVIGGLGTTAGAVVGGVVFGIVEEELVANFPQIHLLLYGSLLVLIVLAEPGGVVGLVRRIKMRIFKNRVDSTSERPDEVLWRRSGAPGR
jgi:branched-chain amino acid transport system permease protein